MYTRSEDWKLTRFGCQNFETENAKNEYIF